MIAVVPNAEPISGKTLAILGWRCLIFIRTSCQAKSPVKTLDVLDVMREDGEVRVRATARSFLHNQVRSMVGALKKVGEGKWPVGAVGEALEARERARSGPVAPPDGLYLVAVDY